MKNLILLAISIAFCFQSMASTHNFCDSAYEKKIDRIENKRIIRAVGNFATTGAIGYVVLVSGVGLPALAFGANAGAIGLIATLSGGAAAIHYLNNEKKLSNNFLPAFNLNREKGLRASMELFKIMDKTKEQLKADAFITYQEVDPQLSYADFKHITLMDVMLKKVNKKRVRKGKAVLSYDELRNVIIDLSKTDSFCPMISGKNRPRTILQIKKILDEEA